MANAAQVMERYPGTRAVFLADGTPPQVGETLKQPDLARTLQLLADKGFDGFYRGEVADKLLAGVQGRRRQVDRRRTRRLPRAPC